MTLKTARNLPAGAEVQTFHTTITKQGANQWTNTCGDSFTDTEVDHMLANGGLLTRVPTGTTRVRGE